MIDELEQDLQRLHARMKEGNGTLNTLMGATIDQ